MCDILRMNNVLCPVNSDFGPHPHIGIMLVVYLVLPPFDC